MTKQLIWIKNRAMYTYTMTFVYNDELGLPQDSLKRNKEVPGIIINKLSKHELLLADFNWSGNYNMENTLAYLDEPYKFGAVIEIRLSLDMNIIKSRDSIYNQCLKALKDGILYLQKSKELHNSKLKKQQSVISFDMKN